MKEVSESLEGMSKNGFYVWNSWAMKVVGNQSKIYSSKNTSIQEQKEAESQGGDNMKIVEVSVAYKAYGLSIQNGRDFHVSNFH